MKMRAIFRLTVSALAVVLAVGFLQPARATATTSLQIPPIAQRFSPPINGDAGIYDCLPATVAMALGYVAQQHGLSGLDVRYQTVRAAFRAAVGGATGKLSPLLTKSTVEALTGGAISGDAAMLPKATWKAWVASELNAGLPPIAVVPDWRALPGEANEQWPAVHAVLITSLSDTSVGFNDPWAGAGFSMSVTAFEAAWAQGDWVEAGWLALGSAPASPTPVVTEASPTPVVTQAPPASWNWDWDDQQCYEDAPTCGVILNWTPGAGTVEGFRIYGAPSTGTVWHWYCPGTCMYEPVGALRCSGTNRQLLADLGPSARNDEVTVPYAWGIWKTPPWCIEVVAYNAAGESKPVKDYLYWATAWQP